jgi:hypothetical protein
MITKMAAETIFFFLVPTKMSKRNYFIWIAVTLLGIAIFFWYQQLLD